MSSCTKEVGIVPKVASTIGQCDTITYTKHIGPLVSLRCISCHGEQPSGNNVQLFSYSLLKAQSDNGNLHGVIIEGPPNFPWMPYGSASGLEQHEKDLINCWIQNGEKE